MITKIITYLKEGALCAYWLGKATLTVKTINLYMVSAFTPEITEATSNSYEPKVVGGRNIMDTR
jgi:hypothetical protein